MIDSERFSKILIMVDGLPDPRVLGYLISINGGEKMFHVTLVPYQKRHSGIAPHASLITAKPSL